MVRKGQKWTMEMRKNYIKGFKKRNYNGDKNPKWRGGRVKFGDGRILVYYPSHPHKNSLCYVFEYRLVAEKN